MASAFCAVHALQYVMLPDCIPVKQAGILAASTMNNNEIRKLTGEYKRIEPECREGAAGAHGRTLQRMG